MEERSNISRRFFVSRFENDHTQRSLEETRVIVSEGSVILSRYKVRERSRAE